MKRFLLLMMSCCSLTFVCHAFEGDAEYITNNRFLGTSVPENYDDMNISGALHRLSSVGRMGDVVTIEDTSIWSVHSWDKRTVRRWQVGDPIVIAPYRSLNPITDCKFEMYNQARRELIRVHLTQIPPCYVPQQTITGLRGDAIICLSDGTGWDICPADRHFLGYWKLGHCVIYGLNNGVSSEDYGYILINLQANHYIRVIRSF